MYRNQLDYQITQNDLERCFKFTLNYHLDKKKGSVSRTSGQYRGLGGIIDSFFIGKIIEIGVASIISRYSPNNFAVKPRSKNWVPSIQPSIIGPLKVTPKALNKSLDGNSLYGKKTQPYKFEPASNLKAAEEEVTYFNENQLEDRIRSVRKEMEKAAKDLDFMAAARFRDEIKMLQEKLKEKEV